MNGRIKHDLNVTLVLCLSRYRKHTINLNEKHPDFKASIFPFQEETKRRPSQKEP